MDINFNKNLVGMVTFQLLMHIIKMLDKTKKHMQNISRCKSEKEIGCLLVSLLSKLLKTSQNSLDPLKHYVQTHEHHRFYFKRIAINSFQNRCNDSTFVCEYVTVCDQWLWCMDTILWYRMSVTFNNQSEITNRLSIHQNNTNTSMKKT